MIWNKRKKLYSKQSHNRDNGFTLVEVVVACAIFISIMSAVAEISVSSLAGSKNLSKRNSIEAAVSNDIQLLQQADSYLTYNSLDKAGQAGAACQNPTSYLINYLKNEVNNDELTQRQIERKMDVGSTGDVVEVSYKFKGPETGIEMEYRVIELNPNFSAQCYTIL